MPITKQQAYYNFVAENKQSVKERCTSTSHVNSVLGAMWRSMNEQERAPYFEQEPKTKTDIKHQAYLYFLKQEQDRELQDVFDRYALDVSTVQEISQRWLALEQEEQDEYIKIVEQKKREQARERVEAIKAKRARIESHFDKRLFSILHTIEVRSYA